MSGQPEIPPLSAADREVYGEMVNSGVHWGTQFIGHTMAGIIDERTHGLALSAVPTGLLIAAVTALANSVRPEGRAFAEQAVLRTVCDVFGQAALLRMPPAGSA